MVRVVIESSGHLDYNQSIVDAGRTAQVQVLGDAALALSGTPKIKAAWIEASAAAPASLIVHFDGAARLAAAHAYPPMSGFGYRLVLDYALDAQQAGPQQTAAPSVLSGSSLPSLGGLSAAVHNAPPSSPASLLPLHPTDQNGPPALQTSPMVAPQDRPPGISEILPGYTLPKFGSSEDDTINSIQRQFGSEKPFAEVRAAGTPVQLPGSGFGPYRLLSHAAGAATGPGRPRLGIWNRNSID
jgi:hypothetical protein